MDALRVLNCKLARSITVLGHGDHPLRDMKMSDDIIGVYACRLLRMDIMPGRQRQRKKGSVRAGNYLWASCDTARYKWLAMCP